MKVAIHHRPGSFSDSWIEYCKKEKIEYKVVNAFDSDIIEQLKGYDAFAWHHHHSQYKDVIAAKRILFALQHAGIKVFPDFNTGWHFDDKVAQKYLLEAIGAPLVPSSVFYDKKEAIIWAESTAYPKVFKLKGGAGAANVKLIKSFSEAKKHINKAFGKGFSQFDRLGYLKERINRFKSGKDNVTGIAKGIALFLFSTPYSRMQPKERGYIYFQDFIPDNPFDVRVVVINNSKAVAEKRFVRKNDFRASGSGNFSYDDIDLNFIELAFKLAEKLNLQSVAFDFIYGKNSEILVVEMSYGFGTKGIAKTPGYWDSTLKWHKNIFSIEEWIFKGFINDEN